MPRLHRGGRFRAWLGARLGGDAELGERAWRRILHGLGALVLLYYLVPPGVLFGAPNSVILAIALVLVATIELLRRFAGLELPTLRPYEEHRVASYAYFGLALVLALAFFPPAIAAAVVLGTALVDPFAGELRRRPGSAGYPYAAFAAYVGLALAAFLGVGHWPVLPALALALLAGTIALAAEWPKWVRVDDDLAMTLAPAIALYAITLAFPGLVG